MSKPTNPMPIPRDLKPGDILIDTRGRRHSVGTVAFPLGYWPDGDISTIREENRYGTIFCPDGTPYYPDDHDSTPIVRIERITSAPNKATVEGACYSLPRSIVRAVRKWEAARKDGTTQLSEAAKIVRAIARRLSGYKP